MAGNNDINDPNSFVLYRFHPSIAAAIIFIILFGITTISHIFQCWKHRALFMIALIVGGCFEFMGYIGRAISSHDQWALGPFIIQSIFILLGPALFAASIYMILGRLIRHVNGEKYSLIRATWLTKIFVCGDVLSFLMQGSGGGIMSGAGSGDAKDAKSKMDLGQNVIIGGLIVQVLFFGSFVVVAAIFHSRARKAPQIRALGSAWERYMYLLYGTSVLIFIRSVFRVVEYAQGNDGFLMRHEVFLYVFDSALMLGVMVALNVVYPGKLLSQRRINDSHVLLESRGASYRGRVVEEK